MTTETTAHAPHVIETIATGETRRRPVPGYNHTPTTEPADPWGPHPTGRALFDKARDAARARLGTRHAAGYVPANPYHGQNEDQVVLTLADYARLAGAL